MKTVNMKVAAGFVAGVLAVSSFALAAEAAHADHASAGEAHATHELTYSHPTPPSAETVWPVPMLMIVAGMFIAAAVIGPIVRMEMGDEPEADAHGHDDAHGHGHDDHGHGGHGHH